MIGNCSSWCAGGDREAGAGLHDACVKAVVVGYDVVQDLIVIVNGHDLPRLRVNRCRYEDVVLQNGIGHRSTSATKHGCGEQIRAKDVIPLLSDIYGVGGDRDAAGCHSSTAGTLEMTSCAATRARRRCRVTAIRTVGDVLPVAVSNDAVLDAKAFLLTLHEDSRRIAVWHKAPIRIEDRFAVGILHHSIGFHYDDRTEGKLVHCVWRNAGGDGVGPNHSDLAILKIVKRVNLDERFLIVGREAYPIDGGSWAAEATIASVP